MLGESGRGKDLGDQWKKRRRRYERWFNRLERADKSEKNLDEMLRRVLNEPAEKRETGQRCSHMLGGYLGFDPKSPRNVQEKEPLVDVFEDGASVVVLAELTGIDQTSIDVHATEDRLAICVDSAELKYDRQVKLPTKVDVGSSSSSLKHGILEIRLKKL